MTRRRLQRLAMEWTVALTNRDIPAEYIACRQVSTPDLAIFAFAH